MDKYQRYENLELFKTIERCLKTLEENDDIEVKTYFDYVVGYIVEEILRSGEAT